jgi:flavin-dependent dehydrogenase
MSWDVAVVGGGLAGAATALRLARAGRSVVLLERHADPHDKVCGEFLSGDAVAALRDLDIDPAALGAVRVERVRLRSGPVQAEAPLPFTAFALSRRRLDEALLRRAGDEGAVVRRGSTVRELLADGSGIRLRDVERDHTADRAVLATGKHDLRGWGRPAASDLIGLKLHLRLAEDRRATLARTCELYLFDGGYAGLQPVEEDRVNLCFVVTRDRYRALGRDWHAVVRSVPGLGSRLDGANAIQARPLAIAGIPYGYLADGGDDRPVYRVGDQAAVIPSFTGDGMAIALHSARLVAEALLAGEESPAYHRRLVGELRRPLAVAGLVDTLAQGRLTRQLLLLACRAMPWLIGGIALHTRAVQIGR